MSLSTLGSVLAASNCCCLRYDTLIMEEAAQILEIETFIPMLLQNPVLDAAAAASGVGEAKSALKRVVLIGDHNQLPPVVQNQALQKYAFLLLSYESPGLGALLSLSS
jgi:superfamily I DNA and/or RNA helicase